MSDTINSEEYKWSAAYYAQKKFLEEQSAKYLSNAKARKTINIMTICCSSVNKDDEVPRIPSSTKLASQALDIVKTIKSNYPIQTKQYILDNIDFRHCEANYSIKWHYCTRPCRITQTMASKWLADPLTSLYYDLVDWCDIVIIATPIRRGNASSLYFKLVERLNCIENQKEVYGVDLIHNQLCGGIIVWAQDGAQNVMWNIMSIWSEFGFSFAKNAFVAYTAWWLRNERTDLVPSQIEKDKDFLQESTIDMLTNQIKIIEQRRFYEKNNQ